MPTSFFTVSWSCHHSFYRRARCCREIQCVANDVTTREKCLYKNIKFVFISGYYHDSLALSKLKAYPSLIQMTITSLALRNYPCQKSQEQGRIQKQCLFVHHPQMSLNSLSGYPLLYHSIRSIFQYWNLSSNIRAEFISSISQL